MLMFDRLGYVSLYLVIIALLFAVVSCNKSESSNKTAHPEWSESFSSRSVTGCFVIYDLKNDKFDIYNSVRADTAFIPASTFKILNSLIALETGAIKDTTEVIKWDGVERGWSKWNQNHTLPSAIKYSTVWFYQELARRIGPEKMSAFVDSADYGNKLITGAELTKFWLEGDLRISTFGQIGFLKRLYDYDLPFSRENIAIVKEILIQERSAVGESSAYVLRAKTGWAASFTPQVGWYVGALETEDEVYLFAMNLDIRKDEDAKSRKTIAREILAKYGLPSKK